MPITFHSLLRILLISPVCIIWLAADISGLRIRAKIMKAFIGRFGVPFELRELTKAETSLSSAGVGFIESSESSER